MKLLWLTDLHLDRADIRSTARFLKTISGSEFDSALVTGDTSIARFLPTHLEQLAQACAPRNCYLVLGNHDFYGSSFAEVKHSVTAICRNAPNLCLLGNGELIRLNSTSALIGHGGWGDGRVYGGRWSSLPNPDRAGIRDLRFRTTYPMFKRMRELGKASAQYFRRHLPYALTCYRRVVIATHVPPFSQAVQFNGKHCSAERLPFYVNASAGGVIKGIGTHFPKSQITVLCGHSHSAASVRIAPNIEARVGEAAPGQPKIQGILDL